MSPVHTLLRELQALGVRVRPDGDNVRLRADRPVPSDLVERVRACKPAMLVTLAAESERLRRLVENVGRREVFFCQHRHEWDFEEHGRRVILLQASHAELDRELIATGHRVEAFGWTTTRDGRWHRIGEAPPTVSYTPAEMLLRETFARAWPLLPDVETELNSATLAALEADMGDDGATGDLESLRALCEEYLAVCGVRVSEEVHTWRL